MTKKFDELMKWLLNNVFVRYILIVSLLLVSFIALKKTKDYKKVSKEFEDSYKLEDEATNIKNYEGPPELISIFSKDELNTYSYQKCIDIYNSYIHSVADYRTINWTNQTFISFCNEMSKKQVKIGERIYEEFEISFGSLKKNNDSLSQWRYRYLMKKVNDFIKNSPTPQ